MIDEHEQVQCTYFSFCSSNWTRARKRLSWRISLMADLSSFLYVRRVSCFSLTALFFLDLNETNNRRSCWLIDTKCTSESERMFTWRRSWARRGDSPPASWSDTWGTRAAVDCSMQSIVSDVRWHSVFTNVYERGNKWSGQVKWTGNAHLRSTWSDSVELANAWADCAWAGRSRG